MSEVRSVASVNSTRYPAHLETWAFWPAYVRCAVCQRRTGHMPTRRPSRRTVARFLAQHRHCGMRR